jgi:hypothetical protein
MVACGSGDHASHACLRWWPLVSARGRVCACSGALQSPSTLLLLAVQTPWENTAKSTGRWVLVDLPPTIVVDVPGRAARW